MTEGAVDVAVNELLNGGVGARLDLLRSADRPNATIVEERAAVPDLEGGAHVVGDDDLGDTEPGPQVVHQAVDQAARDRVEASSGGVSKFKILLSR